MKVSLLTGGVKTLDRFRGRTRLVLSLLEEARRGISMLAELAEQLIRFHLDGPDETIRHIVTTLRLAEAGITAQLAAQAPVVDEQAERRRAKDREAKRQMRAASKTAVESDESADIGDPSPSSSSPCTPTNNYPNLQKQKIAAPLPLDWKPNAETLAVAASLRFDSVALSYELARFSAWAASTDQRKVSWDSCFIYWLHNGKPKAFKLHTASPEKAPAPIDCLAKFADAIANSPEPWKRVCTRLRDEIGIAIYSSWFANMEFDRIEDGRAILTVPSKFLKTWIIGNYLDKLRAVVIGEMPEATEIALEVRGDENRKHA